MGLCPPKLTHIFAQNGFVSSGVASVNPTGIDFPKASCWRTACSQNTFEVLCPDYSSEVNCKFCLILR